MKNLVLTLVLIFLTNILASQTIDELPLVRTGSKKDKPIELKQLKISVFVIENKKYEKETNEELLENCISSLQLT